LKVKALKSKSGFAFVASTLPHYIQATFPRRG
jgi:hypothetical protein